MTLPVNQAGPAAVEAESATQLKRVLGSGFAIAAGVGTIIGLGILRTPGEIAAVFYNPWTYVGLWLGVGLFVVVNILVAAELVGMTPRSGGYYVLVRRALGAFPGFVMGWIDWVSFTAVIALKSTVLAEYLVLLIPPLATWNKPLAIAITSVFALLQMRGIALGASIQKIAAALMSLILLGIAAALLTSSPDPLALQELPTMAQPGLEAYGLVLAAIVFTYDGWLSAAYFGGEIKGGGGAVARACIRGVLVIFVLYVGLNAALAFSVPLEQLAGSELALSRALEISWGESAGTFVLVAAVLILLCHQNINYLTGPRSLYALSTDGFGIGKAARVHARGNPLFAVFCTWFMATLLILVGGFEFLLNLSTLFFVVLYLAILAGVWILRVKEPGTERPFRAWAHPWSTLLCLFGWLLITGFMAYTAPRSAYSAVVLTLLALPVYLALKKFRGVKSG